MVSGFDDMENRRFFAVTSVCVLMSCGNASDLRSNSRQLISSLSTGPTALQVAAVARHRFVIARRGSVLNEEAIDCARIITLSAVRREL